MSKPDDKPSDYVVCRPGVVDLAWSQPDRAEVWQGVNYVRAWREAKRMTHQLATVLAKLGATGIAVRGTVRVDGAAHIELTMSEFGGLQLADLLEALRERQEAATIIRGPDDK